MDIHGKTILVAGATLRHRPRATAAARLLGS